MRQLQRLIAIALGLTLAAIGVRVLLSDPPFVRGFSLVRIVGFVLCLGVGIGFLLKGISGAQRDLIPTNQASRWTLGFSLLPLVGYGGLVAYAFYAWFQVGHWPHYAHPDPKELPHRVLLSITSVISLAGFVSIILVPAGFLVRRIVAAFRKQVMPWPYKAKNLYLAGAAIWALDIAAELSRLPWSSNFGWLID